MPELPEVETVCIGISSKIVGTKLLDIKLNRPDLRWPLPVDLVKRLKYSVITKVSRRGKYILVGASNGETLIIHLGMSGRIVIEKDGFPSEETGAFYHNTERHNTTLTPVFSKHDHVILRLLGKSGFKSTLIYNDARRFGAMDLVKSDSVEMHKWLINLGPEPLEDEFDVNYLSKKIQGKTKTIKSAMIDQSLIAGIGNIYASEILWRAGIAPLRAAGSLKKKEIKNLVNHTRGVLSDAILKGGSSLKDFRNTSGELGYFQIYFNVYDRENKPCKNDKCRNLIKKINQNGRSSFFCNNCQH